MRAFYARAALWAILALFMPSTSFAGASGEPDKSVPQGQDPPGADDGQPLPPPKDEEVIPPPPIGDEDIYMHPTHMLVMRRKSFLHLHQRKRRASRPH